MLVTVAERVKAAIEGVGGRHHRGNRATDEYTVVPVRWRVAAVCAVLAGAAGCSDSESSSKGSSDALTESANDVRVIDGDTFEVTIDGETERVRLIGIDAPENGECMAAEATQTLETLTRARVELTSDVSDRDQYGRLLRYVTADDTFINLELVRQGLALAREYPPDVARQSELSQSQADAKEAQRGLWNPTACGPATAAQIEISAINANPPGDDTAALNDEWTEITNTGTAAVDLTGWSIRDKSASHRFAFAEGFTLEAGATVRVHTGCGEPSATDLYWCNTGSAVWNNDGDTVFVLDPNGNIVVSRPYEE